MKITASLFIGLLTVLPARATTLSSDTMFASSLHAAQAQLRTAFPAASWSEEDALLRLLRDRDPQVRRQAARALKAHVDLRMSTRNIVLALYKDPREEISVRREAAKTLSVVAFDREVHGALLGYAQRGADADLRQISYKALYRAVAQRADLRGGLQDASRHEPIAAVRHAAIWAMFAVPADNRTQDILMDIVRRDPDEAARVEALKSLYGTMVYPHMRALAYRLAGDTGTPPALRRTAILLHSFRVTPDQKDLLERIAAADLDPAMRTAAILSLGRPDSEELYRHFHLARVDRAGVVTRDPLEDE